MAQIRERSRVRPGHPADGATRRAYSWIQRRFAELVVDIPARGLVVPETSFLGSGKASPKDRFLLVSIGKDQTDVVELVGEETRRTFRPKSSAGIAFRLARY